jgi:N-acetylmuramoyl-L-alanine amidase
MKRSIKTVLLIIVLFSISFAQRTDLGGLRFCIDPGHGGNNPANDRRVIPDPGIEFWESESNFQKALLLKPMIEEKGGWVILTRYTNFYPDDNLEPSLSARAAIANSNNVNFFLSIHSNATGGTNTSTNYTLMLFRGYDNQPVFTDAKTMGNILGAKVRQFLRTNSSTNRGDWSFYPQWGTQGLGVLRPLTMPGVLSEGSFHDYFPETRRLMNNHYRKTEAYAFLNSFLQFYGAPADSFAIIAGIQIDSETGKPKNLTQVRLLPSNIVYNGDSYNNGFYLFDRLTPGLRQVVFETPNYRKDTVNQTVIVSGLHFLDKTLYITIPPTVTQTQPSPGDTAVKINSLIGIRFSRPMDTTSVRSAFSMSPPVFGNFTWTAGSTMLLFIPSPALSYSTNYTLTIAATAKSLGGVPIDGNNDGIPGDPFILNFKTESSTTNISGSGNAPHKFELKQNYPNPFNPSTVISYQLSAVSYVTLKVYDILGREVATLVDEEKSPGEYELRLTINDLSVEGRMTSGVYFYQLVVSGTNTLKADSFIDTKKLMILK